jgi:hypothetical protein
VALVFCGMWPGPLVRGADKPPGRAWGFMQLLAVERQLSAAQQALHTMQGSAAARGVGDFCLGSHAQSAD